MTLTPNELQLLKLLAQGKRDRVIASELGIAEQTVRNELHTLYRKLGVRNRTGAVIKAIRRGLITV